MTRSGGAADRRDTLAAGEAFEAMPVGLARLLGDDLRFAAANATYRRLAGTDELLERSARDVLREDGDQRLLPAIERVLATGEPASLVERHVVVTQGRSLWLDSVLAPVHDEAGRVVGVDVYAADVSERVEARLEAEQRARHAESKYARARDLVIAMQDAMLPHGVPILPHVDIAARYLLAEGDTRAGGDWFDALVLDDGRVALVVGDVVGHGVAASTVMGQLRAVLRAAICEHGDPLRAVEFLDRYARVDPAARSTSVVVAVLSADADRVDYVTAGHPPPLVVPAVGGARYLLGSGSGTLGSGLPFHAVSEELAPGDLLVLYSDGLVERPGRTAPHSATELVTTVREARDAVGGRHARGSTGTDRICEEVLDRLTRRTGYADDISVLAAQRRDGDGGPGPAPRLDLVIDVEAGRRQDVREARGAITDWLEDLGVGDADAMALTHAAHEIVTNAVEHGFAEEGGPDHGPVPVPSRSGAVTVEGRVRRDGRLDLEVRDDGRWRPPVARSSARGDRGRGLAMAAALVDDLAITGREGGTRVVLTHHAQRAATLLTGQGTPGEEHIGDFDLEEESTGDRTTVRAYGELDLAATAELESALLAAPRGAGSELVVDLSEVTLLCSAAVQVLSEALRRDDRVSVGRTTLLAKVGTPAQRVLDLVRIPHRTGD